MTIKIAICVIAFCVLFWTLVAIAVFSSVHHSNETHHIPDYSKELDWGCVGEQC